MMNYEIIRPITSSTCKFPYITTHAGTLDHAVYVACSGPDFISLKWQATLGLTEEVVLYYEGTRMHVTQKKSLCLFHATFMWKDVLLCLRVQYVSITFFY